MSSIIHWDNNDGDGLGLADPFYLARDHNVSPSNLLNTDYSFFADGVLIKVVCEALYIPNLSSLGSSFGAATAKFQAQSSLDAARTAMKFAPPEIKQLARGKAVAINANANFGDLIDDTTGTIILEQCWLADAQIIDGQNMEVVKIQYTFAKVADSFAP